MGDTGKREPQPVPVFHVHPIKHVWLHCSFGAGSASEAAVRLARDAGITLIPTGCPAMFCEPVDLAHKCFRWFLSLTGKLPAQIGT